MTSYAETKHDDKEFVSGTDKGNAFSALKRSGPPFVCGVEATATTAAAATPHGERDTTAPFAQAERACQEPYVSHGRCSGADSPTETRKSSTLFVVASGGDGGEAQGEHHTVPFVRAEAAPAAFAEGTAQPPPFAVGCTKPPPFVATESRPPPFTEGCSSGAAYATSGYSSQPYVVHQ
jgi:hypothetical protein